MESHDSFTEKGSGPVSPAGAPGRIAIDRLELQHQWVQAEEEQQVEQALSLYAQAARQRMQGAAAEPADIAGTESEEEREAKSQQLKLQQKCQDIAALMMVDELEEELDEEEEPPKRRKREG